MQAIELFQGGYIEVAEFTAEELVGGLGVQLWLRPTTMKAGSVPFTLGEDPASRVSLMVGERGALRLHVGAAVLVAPGALAEGRWTAVGLEIAGDGAATLMVDGAAGAVGAVPVGAGGRCRLGDAGAGAGFVVAELQVRGQGPLRHYTVVDGAMRDAQRGAARTVGKAQVVAADELPPLRAAKPGALVLGSEQQGLELPALTADLTGGVTIEAWVRPRLDGPGTLLELGRAGGEARVSLRIDGSRRGLIVDVDGLGKAWSVRVEGVLRPDVWQHVCVAIDAKGLCRVYVDTRQVEEQSMSPIAPARDGVRTHNRVGAGSGKGYRGEIAELRLWQGALTGETIEARWLRRACGDEAGLIACYHLDELAEVASDASPRRLHARAYGAVVLGDGLGLPLRARDERGGLQVRATGKLLLDHLPVTLFPDDKVDMPGWMPDVKMPVSSAHRYGTVQGSLVRCAVYEVVFEPRAVDGRKWSGALELRVDAAIKVLRSDGGKQRLVDWKPGATQQLQVSDSGRVRIKVLARSIDCPTLRVRAPGMDADCWTLVRPADAAQQQMRGLTARALQQPPPGKTAVLDPKMKSKDADALARFMRDAAGGLATPAQPTAILKGNAFGDVFDPIVGVAETVGDAFVELGEGIEKLAIAGVEETRKLAAKAAKTAAKTGEAVIRGCIGDARTLAVDGAGAVWGGVQVIGERIVDGVKQTFRTVVAGVLDVVDAIEAFLQRIGASIREFIELLAMLFDWEKFLKKSDQLYDLACKQLDKGTLVEAELRKVPARLDELVSMPRETSLAGKSIGQVFGIDAGAGLPDIDHLKYLSDAIEEAFSGSPPKFAGKRESGEGPSHLDRTTSEKAAVEVRAAHPKCLFDWPWDPLRLPLDEFLAVPEKMWDAGRPVIAPLAQWLADRTGEVLRRSEEILRSRLEVPYLTDLIEVVILRGRKLDLMRLVALIGAVPAVICGDSFHSLGGSKSGSDDKSTTKSAGDEDSDGEQAIRWIQFGFGVFNAGCMVGRAVAEWRSELGWMWTLNCLGGASTVVLGLFDISLAARMDDPAAQGLGITNGVLGVFGGAWMVASTIWGAQALATGEEQMHAFVDGVVEGVLGLGQLTTMSVAAGLHQIDDEETRRALGFFFAAWGLRGLYRVCNGLDNTQWTGAHAATTAVAGAMLAVDLTDGAWALADSFA